MKQEIQKKGEVILYHPSETIKLEVRLENETVWLTQQQIAELFGVRQPAISKHLNNIISVPLKFSKRSLKLLNNSLL